MSSASIAARSCFAGAGHAAKSKSARRIASERHQHEGLCRDTSFEPSAASHGHHARLMPAKCARLWQGRFIKLISALSDGTARTVLYL
jgi:hypothetical protein